MNDLGLHNALVMWGIQTNIDLNDAGIPPTHAKGAAWAKQIRNPGDTTELPPHIDDEIVEEVGRALITLHIDDMQSAMILIKRYRDGWDVSSPALRKARKRLRSLL